MRHRRRRSRGQTSAPYPAAACLARDQKFSRLCSGGGGDVSFCPFSPCISDRRITEYTIHMEAGRPCSETRCQYRFLTDGLP